jgi:predicted nucleic acid-binding protein
LAAGAQFGISITVLAELYYAVYASQHRNDLILLTDDHHLTFVEGIRIENWRA